MLQKNGIIIVYLLLMMALLASAWIAYSAARDYERFSLELTDRLHTKPKAISLLKMLVQTLTFKMYEGYSQEVEKLQTLIAKSEKAQKLTISATIAFFVLSGVLLAFVYFAVSKKTLFIFTLLMVSLIALMVGLFAPILMIVSYKEIPVLGQVVFFFQSKGIITTIQTLWISGNFIVAIPLFLFSVLIPLLKTLLIGLALFGHRVASKSLYVIKRIGKWSMADVFVVALLLTYFTVNKDESTDAQVQVGLYFFMSYVIISIIVSHLITKVQN